MSIAISAQTALNLPVSGACSMCKTRIEQTSRDIIGVQNAVYNIDKQQLSLMVNERLFQKNDLVQALLAVGHDIDGQKASQQAYEALHDCCHYRGDEAVDDHEDHTGNDHDDKKDPADQNHPIVIKSVKSAAYFLTGTVFESLENGDLLPLIGANLQWMDDNKGGITDMNGKFKLEKSGQNDKLIVSYVGYQNDTLIIKSPGDVKIVMSAPVIIEGVIISYRRKSTEISYLDVVKIQNISSKELLKAACCSLAESFDTTPAIDASMTDVVTGIRRIEMLGLAGSYVQITRENIPDVRGLATVTGLSFTPGAWVESMQLNMGAGSVINGFEAITGQINVENKKPCHEEKMHLNAYSSANGRYEVNYFGKAAVNDNWSTATLMHGSARTHRQDRNKDGFLDMPLGKQVGVINRWKYTDLNGQEGQIGVKISYMDNISGQNDYNPSRSDRSNIWGANMETTRAEVWGKRGYVNLATPHKSLGLQFSGVVHDQKGIFGNRTYDANQKSLYFNMIYQNIVINTDHQFRTGTSFQWDQYKEVINTTQYDRNEWVPGVFGEYSYKGNEKFNLVAGTRLDYHNNFGLFFTPRLNLRYAPSPTTVIRGAMGRGQKTASIFAENIGLFASSRRINIVAQNNSNPYGLDAEVAWNYGVSVTQEVKVKDELISLSLDFNRVNFSNQVVVDYDRNPQDVWFYNLDGKSYANSMQIQAEIPITKWVDLRLAYRYNDVKTTYGESLLQKPLISPHRAFANVEIRMGRGWSLDYTANRMSATRLPNTSSNPIEYRLEYNSPSYYISNTQVTKAFANGFSVYAGGENIFDFRLSNPIIAADAPFSPNFDGSLVWGPVMGSNFYTGVRYTLMEK